MDVGAGVNYLHSTPVLMLVRERDGIEREEGRWKREKEEKGSVFVTLSLESCLSKHFGKLEDLRFISFPNS